VAGFDPYGFVDRVEQAERGRHASPDLVVLQRKEWVAMFQWCAER
jgi:hypothetical protein